MPWHILPEDEKADGLGVKVQLGEGMSGRRLEVEKQAAEDSVPRRMSITKADLERHGFHRGMLEVPCTARRPVSSGPPPRRAAAAWRRR